MADLLTLQDQWRGVVKEQGEINDRSTGGAEHEGFANAEDRQKYEVLDKSAKSLEAQISRTQQIEERQRKAAEEAFLLNKGKKPGEAVSVEDQDRAFVNWLKFGEKTSTEDREILQQMDRDQHLTTTALSAGNTISTTYLNRVIESLKAFGGVYAFAEKFSSGNGEPLVMMKYDGTARKAVAIAEAGTLPEGAALQFTRVTLNSYKYTSGEFRISFEQARDSMLDLGARVMDAIAESFARKDAELCLTGTGSGQPEGLIVGASAGITAAASALTLDNLIDLYHSIDPAYRRSGSFRWVLNDATLSVIRKIKDTTGQYIWSMGDVRTGQESSIFGLPYVVDQGMPNIGTGNVSVICGDLSKYSIREVGSIRMKRSEEKYFSTDEVVYAGLKSWDAKVLNSAAIKKLTHA